MIASIVGVLVFGIVIWYLTKCIKQISTVKMEEEGVEVPVQAIITVWGKRDRAVDQGLKFFWYPRDKIGLFVPTITYHLKFREFEVHTRKEGDTESTKPVKVEATIHVTLPRVGREYEIEKSKIPSIWEDCIERDGDVKQYKTKQIERDGKMEDIQVGIIKGECLLVHHLYRSLASDKLFDSDLMAAHFKDATIDGLRAKMVGYTYTECREKKTEIENKTKEYLLTDPANLFVKCGIPLENLDVSITSTRSTDEVEHSLYAEEIAVIEGKAVQQEILALVRAKVDPQIAGMLVKGVGEKGKAINFEAMAHMGIALKFMGIQSPYQNADSISRLTDILNEVSTEEAAAMREILKDMGINV